jgi:bacterioferritin
MTVDPRTLGWLQRALAHEMGAVQQYLAQSVLARLWGETALAEELQREADDELGHAQRLMQRLIELGRAPAAGSVATARLGRNAEELWRANRQLELEAVQLYGEAFAHAQRVRDPVSAALLHDILQAEAAHLSGIDLVLTQGARDG